MKRTAKSAIAPVLFSFFIMGFVDIVGVATNNIKYDLGLSNTMAGLFPNFILIWFLLLSLPFGMLMSRIGRKTSVQLSNIITIVGMIVPLPVATGMVEANIATYIVSFILLGVGNTMLQVSLNPLLTNVCKPERLAGSMTIGQFVKAMSSLLGPQLVLLATAWCGNWNYVFIFYAAITLISGCRLHYTDIPREKPDRNVNTSFASVLGLLKDKFLLSLFLCIMLIVGIDVGLNYYIPVVFKEIFMVQNPTGVNTIYFAARAAGALLGAYLLTKISPKKILVWTMAAAVVGYVVMMTLTHIDANISVLKVLFCLMFVPVGFATANVFSIIFSFALNHKPNRSNAISSLLIMGVAGGGATTFAMGVITDHWGYTGGMSVLLLFLAYILFVSVKLIRR